MRPAGSGRLQVRFMSRSLATSYTCRWAWKDGELSPQIPLVLDVGPRLCHLPRKIRPT